MESLVRVWFGVWLVTFNEGFAMPPPDDVAMPPDILVQQPAPGFDWDGAIQEYVDAHTKVLREAVAAVEANRAERDRIVEAAADEMGIIPGTLGPGNAALPAKDDFIRKLFDLTGYFRTVQVQRPASSSIEELFSAWFAMESQWGLRVSGKDPVHGTWVNDGRWPEVPPDLVGTMEPASNDAGVQFGPYPTLAYKSGRDMTILTFRRTAGSTDVIESTGAFFIDGNAEFRREKLEMLRDALGDEQVSPLSLRVYLRPADSSVVDVIYARQLAVPLVAELRLANVADYAVNVALPMEGASGREIRAGRAIAGVEVTASRKLAVEVTKEHRTETIQTRFLPQRVGEKAADIRLLRPGEEVAWSVPFAGLDDFVEQGGLFRIDAVYGQLGDEIGAKEAKYYEGEIRVFNGVVTTPTPLRVEIVPAS